MSAEDLEKVARNQIEKGIADHLKSGETAIAVSLASQHKLPAVSREERKKILVDEFSKKVNELKGLEVDFGTLSISGQTVEAKIEVENLQQLYDALTSKRLSVYPLIKHQIL